MPEKVPNIQQVCQISKRCQGSRESVRECQCSRKSARKCQNSRVCHGYREHFREYQISRNNVTVCWCSRKGDRVPQRMSEDSRIPERMTERANIPKQVPASASKCQRVRECQGSESVSESAIDNVSEFLFLFLFDVILY